MSAPMNTAAVELLVAKWSEPNGIPFKGMLISDDGCMCAQGQVLHYVAGLSRDDLRNINQADADKQTAAALGISWAHAVLLRNTNDGVPGAPSVVLTDPSAVIGIQAETILAFWRHLDAMTGKQWDAAWVTARDAAGVAAWDAAGVTARDAAGVAAWVAARDAAGVAAGVAARGAARDAVRDAVQVAAGGATSEIQGAALMRERGQPFFFLPMFDFADPEAILAAQVMA